TAPRAGTRRVAIVVLSAIAVGGVFVGMALDRWLVRPRASTLAYPDTTFHPVSSLLRSPTDSERKLIRAQLAEALELTPQQAVLVDSILDTHTASFRQLREEIRPRVEALTSSVRADVEGVLTPEQRARYRKLLGQSVSSVQVQK